MFSEFLDFLSHFFKIFILNVSNTNSYPKPLSAAEEKDYLKKMAKGDSGARNMLISHNMRLVAHIVKKYYAANGDPEDLISIGSIGLIKGIDSFKADKNTRLSSYISRCIENEILMHFRSLKKTAQDVSICDPIDTDKDGNALTLMDVIAVEDTIIEDLDLKIKSEHLYNYIDESLGEREKMIIALRYGLGSGDPMTQREVAQKLDISRSYVSRIEKKALERLRKRYD